MNRVEQQTEDGKLGEIVDEVLSKMARGEPVDIEQYAREHPDVADVVRHAIPALRAVAQSSSHWNSDASLQRSQPVTDSVGPNAPLGDFQILKELGRGGMGVVYEAEQMSMRRKVALKVLPFAGMVGGNAIQRFQNEVRAAASLDHPNIVSVYSVGEERGVHYYAMQLIRGQSLAEVIAQLVALQKDGSSLTAESISEVLSNSERNVPSSATEPTEDIPSVASESESPTRPIGKASEETIRNSGHDRQFYRSVAMLAAQAADALEHAHQNGVLHRDIKPGNLMLDGDSQLFVTDFGLARIESDAAMTMTGDLIGTLRYMSPEQALAKRVVIDHRSDLYSLGMTLYELLTLRPAFDAAADRQELLKKIAFEEPAKPRTRDRSIPRELETIVMKALEKNPEDRYATAQEMADDLRAFLDDRPIKASPPSPWQRVIKWSRRKPEMVTSAAIIMIVIGVGLAVSNMLIMQQRNRADQLAKDERAQREEVERQQALAEQNYQDARAAVDQYLAKVSEDILLKQPGMQELRKELLTLALEYYQGFADRYADDESLRYDIAATYQRMGDINEKIGSIPEAIRWHEMALDLKDTTGVRSAKDLSFGAKQKSHLALLITEGQGDLERAAELCHESLAMHDRAVAADPKSVQYQLRQAYSCNDTGIVFGARGQHRLALEYKNRGVEILEELFRTESDDEQVVYGLALLNRNVSVEHRNLGRSDEAKKHAERSTEMFGKLCEAEPSKRSHEFGRYLSLFEVAIVYGSQGKHLKALEIRREATSVIKKLVDENPAVWMYQQELAEITGLRGYSLRRAGRLDESADRYKQAIATIKKVVDRFPNNVGPLKTLYRSERDLGVTYRRLGRLDEASEQYERSIVLGKRLADLSGLPSDRFGYAVALHNFGDLFLARERMEQAKEIFSQAIVIEQELIHEFPETVEYRGLLLKSTFGLAGVMRDSNEFDDAIKTYQAAIEIGEELVQMAPSDVDPQIYLARSRSRLSEILLKLNRDEEAETLYQESLDTWRKLARQSPEDSSIPFRMASDLYNMGNILKASDHAKEAAQAYRNAIEALEGLLETHPDVVDPILLHHCWVNFGTLRETPAEKLTCFRNAYKAHPEDWIVNRNIAGILDTKAGCELLTVEEALKHANRATELGPEKLWCWYVLGVVEYRNERWDEAEKSLLKAMDLGDSMQAECLLFLAMTYFRHEQVRKAQDCFRRAVDWIEKEDPDHSSLPTIRAEAEQLLQSVKSSN